MTIDVTLTSSIHNPWDGTVFNTDQLRFSYADLGFIPSTSDSYKSTSGDVFKVFVAGVRIYRSSDADYAGGTSLTGFLEDGDIANSKLNGISSVTWGSTSDAVWTIDTANQYVFLDQSAIAATALYGSSGKNVTFTSGTTIVELRRSVSDESTPSIDFSNASILTEQDLDNSSKNVFHLAQQAVVTADNSLPYNVGTSAYEAYQPGTTVKRKITQVADPVSDYDAVNKSFISTNLPNITTVAGIAGNVTTVAGINANVTTVAGNNANVSTVAGNNANVTTVAGISGNVTTVAGISSDVTAVANDATDIGVVAGKNTEIGLLGTSAMAHASTGHLKVLSDINANITTVAGISANTTTVAGISANVTTVAGISANVTAVAGDATDIGTVAGKATEIGLLGTSAMATATTGHLARLGTATVLEDMALLGTATVVEDMGLLGTTDCVADMAILATSDVVIDMNVLGTSGNVTNMNTLEGISGNITTVAGISANVTTVAGISANVTTVATNVAGVNSFAERYRVASSAPTASLDEGDLYYNSTDNILRYYNGTSWTSQGQTEAQSIVTADNSATAMAIALG